MFSFLKSPVNVKFYFFFIANIGTFAALTVLYTHVFVYLTYISIRLACSRTFACRRVIAIVMHFGLFFI
jgi:hypothetical protein